MSAWLLIGLGACGVAPYPAYFDATVAGPSVDSVSPAAVSGTVGGQEVEILGTGLDGALVVTFGSRNAEILSASAGSVRVRVPAFPPGGGPVEVAVATEAGIGRLDQAFTYEVEVGLWWQAEDLSVAIAAVDCPVEAWLLEGAERVPVLWCGIEQGYGLAVGWDGQHRDPGMAANLAGVADLGAIPILGQPQVWRAGEPRPPVPSRAYKAIADDAWLSLHTPRLAGRDFAFVEDRIADLERWYSAWELVSIEPELWLRGYGDDPGVCWDEWFILDGAQSGYEIDGDATGISLFEGVLWFQEDWDGEPVDVEGVFFSGEVEEAGDGFVRTAPSGPTLFYDAYSGTFDGWVARGDVQFDGLFTFGRHALGVENTLGTVVPGAELTGVLPELMSGAVVVDRGEDLRLTWDPWADDSFGPSFVIAELRIFDADVPDPAAWLTELVTVRVRGDDVSGEAVIPAALLAELPDAPNRVDDNGDLRGLHAELTLARHALRKLPMGEGSEAVVDFVHVVQAPVALVSGR